MPSEDEIEKLAVKHEAFGFGLADAKGYTTHGFDPEGLESFVREVLECWGTPQQSEQDATFTTLWEAIGHYGVQVAVTGKLAPSQKLMDAVALVKGLQRSEPARVPLTDAQASTCIPTITLKDEDPVRMVWLKQVDVLTAIRNAEVMHSIAADKGL